uniref:Eukaryotic translation initiation factor 4 gamma 2 n=1 Tax=Eptatretus burgeri TaxID=7764 RepID=A0A8C4QUU4_EPTBU
LAYFFLLFLAEPLATSCGTLGFRGTPVEKHCEFPGQGSALIVQKWAPSRSTKRDAAPLSTSAASPQHHEAIFRKVRGCYAVLLHHCFSLTKSVIPKPSIGSGYGVHLPSEKRWDGLSAKCRDDVHGWRLSIVLDVTHEGPLSAEDEEQRTIAKLKMLGNIKFIGELGKLELLHESILHRCIKTLLDKKKRVALKEIGEDLECLCQILRTVGPQLDHDKARLLMDQYFERMRALMINKELPSRIRFLLQDTVELRENAWQPRKAFSDNGPKLISQIRQDAVKDLGVYIPSPYSSSNHRSDLFPDDPFVLWGGAMGGMARRPQYSLGGLSDVFSQMGRELGTGPGVIQSRYSPPMGRHRTGQLFNGYGSHMTAGPAQFGDKGFSRQVRTRHEGCEWISRGCQTFGDKNVGKSRRGQLHTGEVILNPNLINNAPSPAFSVLLDRCGELESTVPQVKSCAAQLAARAVASGLVGLAEVAGPLNNGQHFPLLLLCLQQLARLRDPDWLADTFQASRINMTKMLPECDQSAERMVEILEEKGLAFLFPLLHVERELSRHLQSDPSPPAFYKWVKENVSARLHGDRAFINILVTCLLHFITGETSLADGFDPTVAPNRDVMEREKQLLDSFQPVLCRFLHGRVPLQLSALYALQVHCHQHCFPKGMLLRWFIALYDLEVVEEEAFLAWKEDLAQEFPGKGKALFQVNQWLTWLETAEEDESEEEDDDAD